MRLNGKYRNQLHTDSIAQVVSSGALGDSGIDIATEKAVGPPLRDGGELPSRGMVDSLKAGQETMVRMSKTMGRLDQVVDGIESGKGTIGKIMSDPGLMNNVAATANGVHEVTAKLQSTNNSAGKLINDPSLGDKFASLSRDIQGVNASVARIAAGPLAANLKETQNRISVLKTDVDDGKGSVGMLIKDPNVRRRLTGSITQANQLMATANIRFGPKSDVRVNLDKLAGESNGLVAKIRSDPKKYLSFDVRLF
jgi:phospholipid/cholesterol/gamma-HCH transport system substrate-binding protein